MLSRTILDGVSSNKFLISIDQIFLTGRGNEGRGPPAKTRPSLPPPAPGRTWPASDSDQRRGRTDLSGAAGGIRGNSGEVGVCCGEVSGTLGVGWTGAVGGTVTCRTGGLTG
jgi:hypothetical protein